MRTQSAPTGRLPRKDLMLLGGIILLGAALRFTGIKSVGLHNVDEAMYARHARFYSQQRWLGVGDVGIGSKEPERKEISRIKSAARSAVESWNAASDDFYNKPTFGHAYLGAAARRLTGADDFSTALVSALFGTGAIWLTFLLASRLFGARAALFAAAFLAVSRYGVYYSRSHFAEADSVFFLAAGLLLRIRAAAPSSSRESPFYLSAVLFGIGTVCHYRWLALFPLLLALELVFGGLGPERGRLKSSVKELAAYCCPILLMELPSYFMMLISTLGETPMLHIHSYLTNLAEVYLKSGQGGVNLSALAVYPAYYALNDGPVAISAALVGLLICLRTPAPAKRSVLYFLAASLILLMGQGYHVERAWSSAIPCLAVLSGGGIDWLLSKLNASERWKHGPAVAAMGLTLALGLSRSLPVLDARSGTEAVSRFLVENRSNGAIVPFVEMGETAYNYYGAGQTFSTAATLDEVRTLKRNGYRWLIFDPTPFDATRPGFLSEWLLIREYLLRSGPPALTVPHGRGTWMNRCFDAQDRFPELWRRWRRFQASPPESIEVFDLQRALSGSAGSRDPKTANNVRTTTAFPGI